MRNIFTLIILSFSFSFSLTAQVSNSSQWTWVNGSNTGNQAAVYGTKGVASANNTPGSRVQSTNWADASGNFWLYSGYNNPDDLWKYDPATNQWTWVKGSNTVINQRGFWGTKGVATNDNTPGTRTGSATWVDAAGNFWLFGGYGFDNVSSFQLALNDLWKYNPATNQWTWVSGSNIGDNDGTYGVKGVAATSNMPGARYESVSWIDASGNLWLFGGAMAANKTLNDLWKYDPAANQWTWVHGSNLYNIPQAGVYGTKGVAASGNMPGARQESVSWTDAAGNFWLFGGSVLTNPALNADNFNDLWKYNLATNQWTWVSGANTINQQGIYGTKGTAAAGNVPGARAGSVSWKDGSGNLWLWGGVYYPPDRFAVWELKNDLWKYDPAASQWTWVAGSNASNQPGTYGTKGTPAATNTPGARLSSVSWKDASGNFWLFGGKISDNGTYFIGNDLWKFGPASIPTISVSVTSTTNPSTAGQSVTFTATLSASSGTPTGTVSFYDGTALLGTVTVSSNTATYSTSALGPGNHNITAVYNGNSTYPATTSAVLIQIVKAATTLSLTSSVNPSTFAQSVSFTAAVSASSGTPTGTVSFYDGTTLLGAGTLSANSAGYSTVSLSTGSHNITAVYSGNNDFAASTSSILVQVVNKTTSTVSLTSSANPSNSGENVSFTATVTTPGIPTGTVSFYDGTTLLGSLPLSGNGAVFTTAALSIGSHNITAMYSGNSNYLPGTSAVLAQVITIPGGRLVQPFPNPIKNNIISFQMNMEKGEYTVTLIDKFGKQLFTKVIQHNGGASIEKITAPHLTGGIYYLKIAGMGITQVTQVVKL